MGLTELGIEELRKLIKIGPPSVLPELLGQFFSIVFGAGIKLLHFFGSDDPVVIVVDDPEEGLAEILIACIGEGSTDVAHERADDKSVEDDTADQDGLFDH